MDGQAAKGKANVGQYNDLVIKCKLQEVEMQKVKEFCELVQVAAQTKYATQPFTMITCCHPRSSSGPTGLWH